MVIVKLTAISMQTWLVSSSTCYVKEPKDKWLGFVIITFLLPKLK